MQKIGKKKKKHFRKVTPLTKMEHFCRTLHPDLDLNPTCLHWFQQATDHCTKMITQTKKPGGQFWATVKSFIFPDRQTSLLNRNMPISIHPNRLTLRDCHTLFLDMVNDYVVRAPRYSAESATNALLWQILYSLMGIMALGSLLVSTIFAYRKYGRKLRRLQTEDVVFAPAQRARAYINRNMRIIKYELRRLRVQHLVQPEELLAPDGTATMIMRMSTKLKLLDTIVTSQPQAVGRLYRIQELMGKKNPVVPDLKVETIHKALRFLEKYPRKLRVLFVFDDQPLYEQQAKKRKSNSPPKFSPLKIGAIDAPPTLTSMPSSLSTSSGKGLCCNSPTPRKLSPRKSSPRAVSPFKAAAAPMKPSRLTQPSPRQKTQIPRSFNRNSTSFTLHSK